MARPSKNHIHIPKMLEMYDGTTASIKLIISTLHLSETWVYEHLNLAGARKLRKYKRLWTKQNDERLVELLGKYDRNTTAKKLGFTPKAIRTRIRRLHLTEMRCRAEWYTLTDVGLLLDMSADTILTRIRDGRLNAHGYNGNGDHKSCWVIGRDDLTKYITTYPRDLEGKQFDVVFLVDLLAGVK